MFDGIQVDMGKPLPFRNGVFSCLTSVAAIHYLTMPSGGEKLPEDRLGTLFNEVKRVSGSPLTVCLHFCPLKKQELKVSHSIWKAGIKAGFSSVILVDQPHSTDSIRWFMWSSSVASTKMCPSCPVLL
jgi:hypothetical protein